MTCRERMLFIGTQFSNLYTAVDTPARGRGYIVGWHRWTLGWGNSVQAPQALRHDDNTT